MVATEAAESLTERMRSLRHLVEKSLDQYLALGKDCPETLREAMRYSLLAPAKRLRPILVLLGCEAVGGDPQLAMPAACAVEMIHTYSLIHDDLPAMDDDDLRRGLPTCHVKFGEANAILAGDGLLAYAFQVVAESALAPEGRSLSCAVLARAAGPEALVGGQADDLAAEGLAGDLAMLERIHRRKTGAMIRVSLELGGIAGGASSEQLERLRQYGSLLGHAFQVVDDLLDVQATASDMGKRTGKDQERGKLTYPGLLGVDESWKRARGLVEQAEAVIAPLGLAAQPLIELAHYVLNRSN